MALSSSLSLGFRRRSYSAGYKDTGDQSLNPRPNLTTVPGPQTAAEELGIEMKSSNSTHGSPVAIKLTQKLLPLYELARNMSKSPPRHLHTHTVESISETVSAMKINDNATTAMYTSQRLRKRPPILLPELWAEIFGYFRTEAPDLRNKDAIYGPLLLAQICRDWREVILSTPTLWSEIRVVIGKSRRNQDSAAKILNLWLERSRAAPLHVHLMEDPCLSWAKPIDPIGALDPLSLRVLEESYRWERFHLETQSPPGTLDSFKSIRSRIPLLREFEITYHRDNRFPTDLQDIDIFDNAPSLRSYTTSYPPLFFSMIMPMRHLRRIDMLRVPFTSDRLPMDAFLKILSSCPNLTYLGINCDASYVTCPPITHTMLEEIFLASSAESRNSNAVSFSLLLNHITAPSLKHFAYIGRVWDDNAFVEFISRSPRLETLNLWCDAISGEDIFRYIHLVPRARKLYFTSSQKAVQFLVSKLSDPCESNAWPPFLRDLKYIAGDSTHAILPGDYGYQLAAGARMKITRLTRPIRG